MTGMIRKATILVALGLVAASAAMAGIISPANCTVPAFIKVVGTSGAGVPDPRGEGTVIVRDAGNICIAGAVVRLNFDNCTDMRLCNGAAVTCTAGGIQSYYATTDLAGVATFTVIGGGRGIFTVGSGIGAGCVTISADGITLGTATANVYDLNGQTTGGNGVKITDLPLFMKDWGNAAVYRGRSDYSQNGSIQITDLPPWMKLWGAAASVSGCSTTYCPI